MANRTPAPVWFQTRPSRYLLVYLLSVHGLAMVGLLLTDLPLPLQLLLGLALLASLSRQLWIHLLRRGPAAVRALHWQSDGRWRVLNGQGQVPAYEDCQVLLAVPALILVRLRSRVAQRWLLLASDSADPQALRLLRVRLRQYRESSTSPQGNPLSGT